MCNDEGRRDLRGRPETTGTPLDQWAILSGIVAWRTSTAAAATLMVDAPEAPGFAKAFSPTTVDPGGVSTLTFTIDNAANAIELTGSLAFDRCLTGRSGRG